MADREEILRRLTLGDTGYLDSLVADRAATPGGSALGHAEEALVRLGALVATDASEPTWQRATRAALDAGLTPDEIVDALLALAPVVGGMRVADVAPKVAHGLGYDVETALERR